jgi:hypothetical protein
MNDKEVVIRLWLVNCPFCHRVQVFSLPQKTVWCPSEDCRCSEKRNGVRALIHEEGNNTQNANWVKVEYES